MENGKTALGLDANVGALLCYLANLVCYLGLIYSIVVIVTDKENKLTRFHAFQSVLLTVVAIVLAPVYFIVGLVGSVIDSAIGLPLVTLIGFLVVALIGLGIFVMMIIAAIKGFGGEIYKIPVIGNFADSWSDV